MRFKLKDIVENITAGQIMSRVSYKEDELRGEFEETVRVLVPSAISGGVIHHENLGSAVLKKAVDEKRRTKQGDIAIKFSSPYDCALITDEDEGLVIPSFCALIRGINEKIVDLSYLVGYLNSGYCTQKLLEGVSSTTMAMISVRNLSDLDVLMPPLNDQEITGNAYRMSCQRKQKLEQMAQYQQSISENVIIEALQEAAKYEQ